MRFIFLIILLSTSSLAQQSSGDSYMRGLMLYVDFCVRCHLPDGTGETGLIPPLQTLTSYKTYKQLFKVLNMAYMAPSL